jgi:glycosyltransferase involved in cell wall biosynthesis
MLLSEKKLLNIVTPCYNESDNILELYTRICNVIDTLDKYNFEILFIDNASTDNTVELLKELASKDLRVKIIINVRNFGHIRSPYWGVIQSRGAASIYMASDLQDPPEYIPQFINVWEQGWKVVWATKPSSNKNFLRHRASTIYYKTLEKISDVHLVRDATGFGIYDHDVLEQVRKIKDPYPFFRGLICELGYPIKTIDFVEPRRTGGISKNNFYSLYDIAMLGIVSHSLVPIRIAGMLGLLIGIFSLITAVIYAFFKFTYWDTFPIGVAPLIIGMFLMFSLLFIFISLLGEYIGSIHTYVKNRPIVVEKERINFD